MMFSFTHLSIFGFLAYVLIFIKNVCIFKFKNSKYFEFLCFCYCNVRSSHSNTFECSIFTFQTVRTSHSNCITNSTRFSNFNCHKLYWVKWGGFPLALPSTPPSRTYNIRPRVSSARYPCGLPPLSFLNLNLHFLRASCFFF